MRAPAISRAGSVALASLSRAAGVPALAEFLDHLAMDLLALEFARHRILLCGL
jgi:hypothetical protein